MRRSSAAHRGAAPWEAGDDRLAHPIDNSLHEFRPADERESQQHSVNGKALRNLPSSWSDPIGLVCLVVSSSQ